MNRRTEDKKRDGFRGKGKDGQKKKIKRKEEKMSERTKNRRGRGDEPKEQMANRSYQCKASTKIQTQDTLHFLGDRPTNEQKKKQTNEKEKEVL